MGAPAVQDINALIAQYKQAFQPQQDVLDQQVQANDQSGTAAEAGLNAKKTQEFGNIEQAASDKGMAFSGFSPDQQAKYTGTTFLPALAGLQSAIANTRLGLLGKKADLNATANSQALDTNAKEKSAYEQWVADQEKMAFQAHQADLDRQTQMAQSQLSASSKAAPDPAKGFGISRDASGGMQFHGANGMPVTAAQYASATGGNIRDLLAANGTEGSKQVVKLIDSGMSYGELNKRYPYIFGGV